MKAERSSVDDNVEKAWYQDGKTSLFELLILLPSMLLQWFAFTLLVTWDNASKSVMEDWLLKKMPKKRKNKKMFHQEHKSYKFPIFLVQDFQALFTSQEHKTIDQILRGQSWGCFHFQATNLQYHFRSLASPRLYLRTSSNSKMKWNKFHFLN